MPAPRTDFARDKSREQNLRAVQKRIVAGTKAADERKAMICDLFASGYPLAAIAEVVNSVPGSAPITPGAVQKIVSREATR